MPIGSGIVYNTGDLILSQVSSSGTAFLETKIAAATSSLIYFDSTARINSASLNSITVGTASYVSGSTSIITNLTASNISASGTVIATSFTGSLLGTSSWASNALTASFLPVGTYNITSSWSTNALTASSLVVGNSYTITNLTASNISASGTSSFGYVGIGTNSPIYKLDVQPTSSTARIGQSLVGAFPANPSVFSFFGHSSLDNVNTAANYAVLQSSTGDSFLNASSGRTIYFRLGNSDKMILNSSGQFGIGTTSPITGYLDVRSNQTKSVAGPTSIAFFGSSDGGNPLGLVVNHESSSGIKMVGLIGTEYGSSGNNIKINETLTVQYNGNVGIGTVSPVSLLSVQGNINVNHNSTSTNYVYRAFTTGHAAGNRGAILRFGIDDGAFSGMSVENTASSNPSFNSQFIDFKTHEGGVSVDTRMRITATGDILISTTTSPSSAGISLGATGTVRQILGGMQNTSWRIREKSAVDWCAWTTNINDAGTQDDATKSAWLTQQGFGNGNDAWRVGRYPAGSSALSTFIQINSSGNVGIGTTNPAYLLDVSGSSRHGYRAVDTHQFTGSVSVSGSLNATASWANNVVSASYALTSSFATRAQTANALNASNTYSIAGLTSAYVDVDGSSAPTTGIYRPSTKTLGLSADGTLIFKISNASSPATSSIETGNFVIQSGNFGLGTNSPNNKLDIFGATGTTLNMSNVDDGSRGGKLTFISSSATGRQFYVGTNSSIYNLVFGIDSIEKMRLDTSGYFAINTTNTTPYSSLFPGQLVVDAGTSNVDGIFSSTNNTNAAELILTKKNPTNNFGSLLIQHSGSSGDAIALNYNVNTSTGVGGTNSFKVTTDGTGYFRGNVGIGTSSPATKLDVKGHVFVANAANGNNTIAFGDIGGLGPLNGAPDNLTGSAFLVVSSSTASGAPSHMKFYTTTGGVCGERMRIDESGNVGIGATVPAYKLDVSGTARVGDAFFVTTGTTADARVEIGSGRTGNGNAYVDLIGDATYTDYGLRLIRSNGGANTTSAIAHRGTGTLYITTVDAASISLETTNTTRMTITSGGNVGIGTTIPAQKLEVQSGSVLIRGDGTALFGTYYASAGENTFFTLHSGSGNTFHIGNDVAGTNYNTMVFTAATDSTGGKVGIGTSSPGSKLQINDNTPVLTIRTNDGGVSRKAYIDFYTTFFNFPSDVGARRTSTIVTGFDSGTWGTEFLAFNVGSGSANDAALLPIERARIDGSGNLGIGTTVPTARLHVSGSTGGVFEVDTAGGATSFYVSASGNVGIGTANATDKLTLYGALASYKTGADTIQTQVYLANTGNTRAFNLQLNSGGTGLDLWSYNSSNAWLRHTTFDYNGSVGIGTATSILGKLQLDSGVAPYYGPATGSATPNGMFTLGSVTGDVVNTFGVDASATAYAWIQPRKVTGATYYSLALNPNGGNVGIGTVTPAAKLEITGSSNSALLNIKSPISGAILYVSGSGAVGIGTSNVGAFTLQVSGSFGATTKSFIIDHPTKAGKKLMYGSLESPYHGIRLTGRDTLVNGKCKVELPDYIYKLILHDSVNIQLTGIKCNKTLYVDDINIPENYFTIAYDKAIFESYKDYDFFWDFTAIRADVPELTTEL